MIAVVKFHITYNTINTLTTTTIEFTLAAHLHGLHKLPLFLLLHLGAEQLVSVVPSVWLAGWHLTKKHFYVKNEKKKEFFFFYIV